MIVRNETEIQLLKILFKNNGKATKNLVSKSAYPHGIEQKFFRRLKSIFKPLTDYVNKYLDENMNALLRGDSLTINLDAIPGRTFRNMIANLENWISIYMPDTKDSKSKNVIYMSLNETADEAKEFGEKEFEKMLKKGINVELPLSSDWWNDMKTSWAEDNYTLITSNAKNFVSKINTLTEQAIVNGLSSKQLMEDIKKATEGLSDKHCRLLARDQIGKLNGQITQAQMQEIGLDLYVWETSGDERVRSTHVPMDGLLCRWDDASVCSYNNGKTWEKRPAGAVQLHPGQDIQCRCVALSYYPELISEMENIGMSKIVSDSPPVQDIIDISSEVSEKYITDFSKEIIKNFSSSEKKAFGHYTESSYYSINNYLRGEPISFSNKLQTKNLINKMDKAFEKNKPLDVELKLYRTEWLTDKYSPNYNKGEKINLKSFVSTSIDKHNAKSGNFEYEIIIPKNKKAGIYIDSLSSHNEKEFLLNRNMWYEVVSFEEKDKFHKKIILKLLGNNKDD